MVIWRVLIFLLLPAFVFASPNTKEVGIAVSIDDINRIYPAEETINLEMVLDLKWQTDHKVAQDEYYSGAEVADVLKQIWFPYYQIIHSRGKILVKEQALHLSSKGFAEYSVKINTQVETRMNMRNFPFDKQTFKLLISPFKKGQYQQQYYTLSKKVMLDDYADLHEWRLTNVANKIVGKNKNIYELSLSYERKSAFYIYKIFIPLLLILIITHSVFWIDSQPMTKISIIITAMLTCLAFQWVVLRDIPPVNYMTLFQALLIWAYLLIASKAVGIVLSEVVAKEKKLRVFFWAKLLYLFLFVFGGIVIYLIWR